MRSTRDFAGLDCKGTDGRAFSAFLKRDLKDDLDFWHCLCHQLNLAVNDALDAIEALKLYWVPHLRMMHSEFKRSSVRREEFKEISEGFDEFDWKVFLPILFCITRWIGIQKCAAKVARSPDKFRAYAQLLRDKGMGPRDFDPYKYSKRRGQADAAEAGADDAAGDDTDGSDDSDDETDSEEEEESQRIQEAIEECRLDADGYQPAPQLFDSMEEAAASAPAQEDMVAEEEFDSGNTAARGRKKKNLLNADVGITEINLARSCWMAGALLPYKVLVEKLQVTGCPQQHLAARRIREFYMQMEVGWIGTRDTDPMYPNTPFQNWMKEMTRQGKQPLVKLVCLECRSFCSVLIDAVRARLKPTWDYIQALELVDPMGPDMTRFAKPTVWEALQDLCKRRDINFDSVRQQIIDEHASMLSLPKDTKNRIIHDLVGYCRDKRAALAQANLATDTAELDKLRCAVFSIALVSAFVESLFSKMDYNQSKIRSRLADDTMTAVLHVHDAVVADPMKPLETGMTLKTHVVSMLDKQKMMKHVGKVVCKLFEDGERYHGRIIGIDYHEVYARWMYKAQYADGDCEDYWRSELEILECRCTDVDHSSI